MQYSCAINGILCSPILLSSYSDRDPAKGIPDINSSSLHPPASISPARNLNPGLHTPLSSDKTYQTFSPQTTQLKPCSLMLCLCVSIQWLGWPWTYLCSKEGKLVVCVFVCRTVYVKEGRLTQLVAYFWWHQFRQKCFPLHLRTHSHKYREALNSEDRIESYTVFPAIERRKTSAVCVRPTSRKKTQWCSGAVCCSTIWIFSLNCGDASYWGTLINH